MNFEISISTEKYHLVKKSTYNCILASTEAVWGWAITFDIDTFQKYIDIAQAKHFLAIFWILKTNYHVFTHSRLTSAYRAFKIIPIV